MRPRGPDMHDAAVDPRPVALPAPRAPPVPDRQVRAAARAGGGGRHRGAPRRCSSRRPVPWAWLEAVHDGGLLERIRGGTLTLRESRGLGLPWSAELVERGRRAVGGSVAAARFARRARARDEPRRRHAPRRPRLRARLLPVQRRRGGAARAARRRAWRGARWSSTATSTRATAPRTCSRATRPRSRCRCTAPATTRSSGSRPTSTSTSRAARATTPTWRRCPGRWTSRSRARRPTSRSTWPAPTRGRATGSAGSRSPRPACAPATSSCSTACARRRARLRRAGRRLRRGRARHGRHQRRDGGGGRAPSTLTELPGA